MTKTTVLALLLLASTVVSQPAAKLQVASCETLFMGR